MTMKLLAVQLVIFVAGILILAHAAIITHNPLECFVASGVCLLSVGVGLCSLTSESDSE
jgi:hypothetical protein